jgi:4-carboxymuconolactone decarboxylase
VSRLPSPDRSEWAEQRKAMFEGKLEPGDPAQEEGGPPNILWTVAHHPALLEPFLAYSATLALRGVLSRRDSEILAMRASWNCRSAFEWGHHAEFALSAGISEDEIARLAASAEAEGWSDRDRLLVRAADQLHDTKTIDDETWSSLSASFEAAALVEITFVVGHYTMLSMVANATAVPLERNLVPLPRG